MDNERIPDEALDAAAGGEGVSQFDETVLVMMIINAKLHDMTLQEFYRNHPKYAADPDIADYISGVWNS